MYATMIMLSQIADYVTTYFGVTSGKGREGNPVASWIIETVGIGWGFLLIKIIVGFFLIRAFRDAKKAGYFAIIFTSAIALSNLAIIIK